MLSHWVRTWLPGIYRPFVHQLKRLGVTPNALTAASLAAAVLTGFLVAFGRFLPAAITLAIAGVFDSLDGELARQHDLQSRLGPFLDSVADHYGDFCIYLGILIYALQLDNQLIVILCFVTLFGSVVGSHIRSRAGMIGVDTKRVGVFTRMERTLVLLLGFLTGWITLAMAILAVATNLSALQRFLYVLKPTD